MAYKWKLVALLFCCAALNYGDRAATSSLFPLFRTEMGMTDIGMAAVGSFFLWSYAIGSPIAGRLADRLSRSRVIAASLAAWSLITLATGFVTSVQQLLASRVLLGVAECFYLPASIALIADHHGTDTRATAIGIHTAGLSIGVVAGGWASGYLGDHFGWQTAFQVLGAAGLVLALAAWFWLCDPPLRVRQQIAASPFAELAALLRVRTYLLIISEAALVAFANLAYMNWLPLYFRETFDMTLAGAGFSGTFLMQFPAVLGAALGGVTSDRVARREKRGRLLLQSCCYMGAAPLLLVFSGSPPLAMISTAIFSFGLLRAIGSANENPMLCDLLPTNVRSTAVGLMNATSCLAGGIGIFVAGYLKSAFGLGGVFAASSVLLVLAAAILAAAYRFQAPKDLAASSGSYELAEQTTAGYDRSRGRER